MQLRAFSHLEFVTGDHLRLAATCHPDSLNFNHRSAMSANGSPDLRYSSRSLVHFFVDVVI